MGDKYRLVLDVGGSFIKYAVVREAGGLQPGTVGLEPANAHGSAEEIFAALGRIIRTARENARITNACVSIPGPFDFARGVSHMKHKFPALYEKSLRTPFENEGVSVVFVHDSTAFLLGEYYDGALCGAQNPCCVMLGTGLGFAAMRGNRVLVDERQTPALTLWCTSYLKGIAEDYVSARAIQALFGGDETVRDIAVKARAGDEKAREAFRVVAGHLSSILKPVLARLECDRFVLGGQIAKSADLLPLDLPIPWETSAHLGDAALRGADWYSRLGRDACTQTVPKMQY